MPGGECLLGESGGMGGNDLSGVKAVCKDDTRFEAIGTTVGLHGRKCWTMRTKRQ